MYVLHAVLSRFIVFDFCDPVDYRLPGSSVHGILQTRIPETVAISFSRGSSWPRDWTRVSYVTCIGRCVTWKPLVLPGKPHSNITSVLTNGGNLDRKTDMNRETDMPRGKLMWRHMGRRQPMTGVMHLSITHNAEHQRSLTSNKRWGRAPSRAVKKSRVLPTPWFWDSQPPELWDNKILLF